MNGINPESNKRPVAATIFAIIIIIQGALMLCCCVPLGLLGSALDSKDFPSPDYPQNYVAYLYATTDLATIAYRMNEWDADEILYVVDHRQSEHFHKLFAVANAWNAPDVKMHHISFGTVTGGKQKCHCDVFFKCLAKNSPYNSFDG